MILDTGTPAGRAMFQMLGVFAEFERAMIRERVKAGMVRARAVGTRSGRAIGRPPVDPAKAALARQLAAAGESGRQTAKLTGLSRPTVLRLRRAEAVTAAD